VTVPEVEEESIWEISDGGELIFHLSSSSSSSSLSLSFSQASAASYFSLLFFPFFLVSFVELAVGGRGYKKRRIDMNVLYVYSCLILLYFSAIFGIKIVLCYFFS
jgi:hypothetical protein